ncbi:MAG: cyclic nucleotide-binding and patatin-like phospholipase domain-containing protein [Planctomycetota bacterium]
MTADNWTRLRQIEALSALSDDDLKHLQSRLRVRLERSGTQVCTQGDSECSLFIVAAGRLQVIRTDATGHARVVGQIPPGELFGEIALITSESRFASAVTLRDTVLWELSEADYCALLSSHPVLARSVTRIAIRRLRESSAQSKSTFCQTITVIPTASFDIVGRFVLDLIARLRDRGPIAVVDSKTFPTDAGRTTTEVELELVNRLNDLERTHAMLIYVGDEGTSEWNQRCLRQSDRILVVADADSTAPDHRLGLPPEVDCGSAELVVIRESKPVSGESAIRWSSTKTGRGTHFIQGGRDEDWRTLIHSLVESIAAPEWLRRSPLFSTLSEADLRTLLSGMEIVDLSARDVLFQQGTPSDGLFIVVNGRLQAVVSGASGDRVVGAMGRGEVIGEISLLTEEPRTATVSALRDSTVAKLPLATWKRLSHARPEWTINLARVVVDRLSGQRRVGTVAQAVCFTVQPLFRGKQLADFVLQLESSLAQLGRCCVIDATAVDRRFGFGSARLQRGESGEAMIVEWLHRQELSSEFIIYVCEETNTPWTQRCLRQADQILLLADAEGRPELTELEQTVFDPASSVAQTPRQLVLLHPAEAKSGQGTIRWLQPRVLRAHHHLRSGNTEDSDRLARLLTQRASGIALSGGGSCGVAHVGVLRAIREAGIPIDVVYGTSAGAAIAALVGMETSVPAMLKNCDRLLTRTLGHFLSMGPPIVSIMSGRHPSRLMEDWFGDALIEDQFVPFGIVSADMVTGTEYVYRHGLIRVATRASASLPGAWPPVIDGDRVLVDGGVVNNLPVDLLRSHCLNGKIIAVDIGGGGDDYSNLMPYGLELSGWKILAHRLFTPRKQASLPAMMGTISRCCTLTSANRARSLKTNGQLLMLQPPVTQYGMFDIRTLKVIREVEANCYDYARGALREWHSSIIK